MEIYSLAEGGTMKKTKHTIESPESVKDLIQAAKQALEYIMVTHGGENDGDIQEDLRKALSALGQGE